MSPQFATDSRSSIAVTALSVERMDGLTPRYDIDTLCAGVNIVYGPNSSGKSRTAEAIQALFWPSESKLKAQLRGVLTAQSDLWNIAYNDGQASHRRNGVPEGATNLSQVPSAHRDRYLLTLHDMLSDDNGNLAEEIQRASAGGYDLKAARASMKLMDLPPKPSGTTYNKAYRDAKNATSEIRTELGRLQSSEESLSLLRQKLDAAIAAGRRQLELTAALDHARAKERLADHVLRQAQFHPLMRSMDGAESKTATTLRDNLVLLSQELGKFTSDQREAQREWDEAGFPGELPELETLHAIALRLDTLRKHTADLRSKKQEIAGRKSKRDAAQANFSGAIDDSRIADFNVDGIRKVVESQRAVENARADVSAKDQLDKWTGNLQEHDIGPLRNGVDLLSERIGVPGQEYALPPHGWIRAALISSAIAIVVEALLLSSLHSRGYAVLTLLAIPAIIAAFRSFEPATAGRAKKVEDDYRSLHLDMPAGWTRDEILPVLTELRIELARKEVDNQKSKRWGGLQTERDEATSRLRTAEADFETLNREFGLPASADHRSLDLLATSLSQWRQASDELTVAEAAGSSIALEIQDVLAVVNDGLGVFGIASVDDEEGATANFRQLENRVVVARSAQETARTAQWVIEDKTKQIATQQETLANIFSKLELAVGDFRTLEEWCERQPQCRDAQKALDTAEQHVAFTRGRLFDGGDLEMASRESLENELTQPATSAATHQGLQDEITKIQTLVDSAKRESRLETAIHEERKALEDLQSARQTDYEKAVGWQAMEFVRTRTRDVNRPTVFNAAIEHFTHFTAGAYRLEMSEGSTPLFQAVNTSSNARLGLDELSSGTRVQLLIAVRLAFIETIEQRAQLPLLMDETLANSGDMRANAIIDATIEICRRGRQIIYFTARPEEVAKWKSRVAEVESGVPFEIIDLAHARGIANTRLSSSIDWGRPTSTPVRLALGADRETTRTAFLIGPVDPWAETIDGVDLWYLIPDVPALAQLRDHNVTCWGQFKSMRLQLKPLMGNFDQVDERAECRARALEAALVCWRIGRPRRFNVQDLDDSGMVTPKFRTRAIELAGNCEWNGEAYILALKNKQISGFRNTDEMKSYFSINSLTSEAQPMPSSEVRLRSFAAVADAINSGTVTTDDLDDLLQSLGAMAPDDAAPPIAVA